MVAAIAFAATVFLVLWFVVVDIRDLPMLNWNFLLKIDTQGNFPVNIN